MVKQTEAREPHRFLVHGLVFLGMVVAVGSSLGAPLIPMVASRDHVSLSQAQWTLTLPFLVSAVATPAMGRLGDGPHRRTVIMVGLAIVACGGLIAALPFGFGALLLARAMQGVGLGLLPLAITTARHALPARRVDSAVAMLSITAVAGIGLGYPITGLIAQFGGLHAAYWFAFLVAIAALAICAVVVPSSHDRPKIRLDLAGALLFGAVLVGVLLVISQGSQWGWTSPKILALAGTSVVLLAAWVVLELKLAHPLVDLRLMRERGALTANVVGLLGAIGMYEVISLVTRLVQTPTSAGYGFGSPVVVAGLMLVPFSAASLAASKLGPALARRTSPTFIMAVSGVLMIAAMLMFCFARSSLTEIVVMMAAAGLGIGSTYAVIPGLIVNAVPRSETGSALSFNQVLRYVGYGLGSALSALILQAHTPAGQELPERSGYTVASLIACALWVLVVISATVLPRLRSSASESVRHEATRALTPQAQAISFVTTVPEQRDRAHSTTPTT